MKSRTSIALLSAGALSLGAACGLRTSPTQANPAASVASSALSETKAQAQNAQIARFEKELCDLANVERRKRGMPLLKISPELAAVARAHSREMAEKSYFAHESPTRSLRTPLNRYRARIKTTPRLVAENIYKLEGYGAYRLKAADFRATHEAWMKSPHHRENILRTAPAGGPTYIGVGIFARNNAFWATQNFARP